MPLSGGYFYPSVNIAYSSYTSLFLNETSSVPFAVSNKGIIYVKSSDGLIYYKDDAGNEYSLTASGSSSSALLTGSVLVPSPQQIDVQGQATNTAGNFILSGVAGVAVSGNLKVNGQIWTPLSTTFATGLAAVGINCNNANSFVIFLSGASNDVTGTLSNLQPGASYLFKVVQGPVARNFTFSPRPKLPSSGSALVISTVSGSEDILTAWYDGASLYVNFNQNYQ
jgi:hypothetical protein